MFRAGDAVQEMSDSTILVAMPGAAIRLPFFSYLATGADRLVAIGTALVCWLSTEHTAMRGE
jgi:hypothetical protein